MEQFPTTAVAEWRDHINVMQPSSSWHCAQHVAEEFVKVVGAILPCESCQHIPAGIAGSSGPHADAGAGPLVLLLLMLLLMLL
jgi:hypothetical protein